MPKKIIFPLLLVLSLSCFAQAKATLKAKQPDLSLPIVQIHDGDTIETRIESLPGTLGKIYVRVKGIDTPEMPAKSYSTTGKLGSAGCTEEANNALAAREAVTRISAGTKTMILRNYEWDKYGGRILADVHINNVNISALLIQQGYGISYEGEKKTHEWCPIKNGK